ncbi:MAG: hypothetical protein WC678_00025 [Parcubacteria group bacterium]|jgi:hypothetical protein
MAENIYVSLDEAREEIRKRWNDVELRKKVEEELGDNFMPEFKDNPRAVLFRQICPADNGFEFFFYSGKYIKAEPLILEYHDDMFVSFNEEKKGLGRLRVRLNDGSPAMIDIMNFHENEKKKLGECVLKTGEKLVDFHHNLFNISMHRVDCIENSNWFHNIGDASRYYYYVLLHFVAHGVLFDVFQSEEDEAEDVFTREIVLPTIEKIKQKFNIKPLIIRLYPSNQSTEEDFYWWCYPPVVNKYIIDYAEKHELPLKKLSNN